MAKKNKGGNALAGQEQESKGSKAVTALIAIIIILIWLAVFAFLIKLDVGGIGSNVLYPVLKDVPVINKILPEASEEQQASEGNYKYNTLKSANERIAELEKRLESETGTTTANSDYIAELEAEVRKLQRYKDDQDAFEKRVARFDERVVFNNNAPDISEYRTYYEEIAPENAEKIYQQVLDELQYSENAKTLATVYSGMEPANAATRLTEMPQDLDLICDILRNMKESQAAQILENLDATFAAQITKKLATIGTDR